MIDFYTWWTPNGRKVALALEEMELEYKTIPINIGKNDQFTPEFIKINPNSKIPAIVDRSLKEPLAVFESGAILIYLAEKTAKFIPQEPAKKAVVLEWLFLQAASFGPNFGQLNHFRNLPEPLDYPILRFQTESDRLLKMMNQRLEKVPYLAGDDYTIADMMFYPWLVNFPRYSSNPAQLKAVEAWADKIGKRPKTEKVMHTP